MGSQLVARHLKDILLDDALDLRVGEPRIGRQLKSNTAKKRTHSLFRQGCCWYLALPNMRAERARPLLDAYERLVREHRVLTEPLGIL